MGDVTRRIRFAPVSFFSTEAAFLYVRLNVKNIFVINEKTDLIVELFFGKHNERDSRMPIPLDIMDKIKTIPDVKEIHICALERERKMIVRLTRPAAEFYEYQDSILQFLKHLEECVKHLSHNAIIGLLIMNKGWAQSVFGL